MTPAEPDAVDDAGWCAAVSHTRKSQNQDAWSAQPRAGYNTLTLADGLGGLKYGREASQLAVNFVKARLSWEEAPLDMAQLFAETKRQVQDLATVNGHTGEQAGQYGTTLLVAQETPRVVRLAYVGNGAIWHVRPQALLEPARQLVPWSVVNYLNPHSRDVDGAEALYRLISDNALLEEAHPTVVDVVKDPLEGDIFVLCTDGIYSADQPRLGQNAAGLWVQVEKKLLELMVALRTLLRRPALTDAELAEGLASYLRTIEHHLDDDATIGVLVTATARRFLTAHAEPVPTILPDATPAN